MTSQQVPGCIYGVFSQTDRELSTKGYFAKYGYKVVYQRDALQMSYQIPESSLTEPGEDNPTNTIQVRELTRFNLRRMFQAKDFCRELFPQGRIFNWYVGYRLMEENIRHWVTPWGGVFASFQNSPASTSSSFSVDHSAQANSSKTKIGISTPSEISRDRDSPGHRLDSSFPYNVAMVTFYNCHPTAYGAFYSLDAYAMPGVSRDHFQAHLRQNLNTLQRRFPGQRAALALTFDAPLSRECVISGLADHGISEMLPHQQKL
ncbi:hypothetical protein EGW08_020341, partial [Elysia chlorotica]